MVSPPNPSNQAVQQDHIVILNHTCVLPSVQGIFLPLASKTKTQEVSILPLTCAWILAVHGVCPVRRTRPGSSKPLSLAALLALSHTGKW